MLSAHRSNAIRANAAQRPYVSTNENHLSALYSKFIIESFTYMG